MKSFRTIQLQTNAHAQMIEVTEHIHQFIKERRMHSGLIVVHSPHTTAGITVNENADPDVVTDVLRRLDEQYPWEHHQDLHFEGNTAAHMKAITTGTSTTLIVQDGMLQLGLWQGIYFCEFDGPRERKLYIKAMFD